MKRSAPEPNVILRGGPSSWSDERRVLALVDPENTYKPLNGNRYEHFEPTEELVVRDGRKLRVFAWTRCTYIAE